MDTDQEFRDQLAICKAATFLFDAFPHASCADLARGIAKYRGGADFKAYRKSGASRRTSPSAEWHQFLALTDWEPNWAQALALEEDNRLDQMNLWR
jgi:hypothetical protein